MIQIICLIIIGIVDVVMLAACCAICNAGEVQRDEDT